MYFDPSYLVEVIKALFVLVILLLYVLPKLHALCKVVCKPYIIMYSFRHKQRSRKVTAVELTDVADTDSVDSKEEQDTSVDNTCYMKLASKLQLFIIFFFLDNITVGTSNNFGTFRFDTIISQILARKVILLKMSFLAPLLVTEQM